MTISASRRRLLGQLLASGALGATGTLGLIGEVLAKGEVPIQPGINHLRGELLINGKPARKGDLVRRGDTLATGANAEAMVVIERDAFLLREKTQVQFGKDALKDTLRLVTGKILSVFAKGEHTLLIPSATIGIRGTGAYLEAVEAARDYFCLCYGETELQPTGGKALAYTTSHHEKPVYVGRDGQVSPAQVINHSDAELTMLENLVGRWPPFGSAGYFQ